MTKTALWICVCADDWTAESAIKASNDLLELILLILDRKKQTLPDCLPWKSQFMQISPLTSVGGTQTYNFAKISKTIHEIEKILRRMT